MEDCTCFDLYSAYCIRCTFMDIDVSTKSFPIIVVIIIIFLPKLAPITITISKSFQSYSVLLLPPTFLFLGSPILLPTYFLYAYEKSWTGGRQIKILKLQEKKSTLLVQLFMNDS